MTKAQLFDAAERVAWTFVQALGGVIIASGGFGADVWKAAAIAGGLAAVKAIVALNIGRPNAQLPNGPQQ